MAEFYVTRWEDLQDSAKLAVWFDNRSENALVCGSPDEAEKFCLALNTVEIEIPLLNGGKLICKGFQVEELQFRSQSKRFVVRCHFPELASGRAYVEGWIFDNQVAGEATKSSGNRIGSCYVND